MYFIANSPKRPKQRVKRVQHIHPYSYARICLMVHSYKDNKLNHYSQNCTLIGLIQHESDVQSCVMLFKCLMKNTRHKHLWIFLLYNSNCCFQLAACRYVYVRTYIAWAYLQLLLSWSRWPCCGTVKLSFHFIATKPMSYLDVDIPSLHACYTCTNI